MAVHGLRLALVASLLLGAALAGCSGDKPKPATDDTGFDDLGLTATSSTGVIRGVVVDDAVRPLAGASVTARGQAAQALTTTSDANGLFGFSSVAPGTYFVSVHRNGYKDAQTSIEVTAGVVDPPIARILLTTDPASRAYYTAYVFTGYIECSTPVFALCGFVNGMGEILGIGNSTQDNSQVTYLLDAKPAWVQSEMVWDSTQALGGEFALLYSYANANCDDSLGFYCDYGATGTSPLLLAADAQAIDQIGLGTDTPVYIRVFTNGVAESMGLAGATLEQGFDIYTHVFYGYTPPTGWRLSDGGPVPNPPTA